MLPDLHIRYDKVSKGQIKTKVDFYCTYHYALLCIVVYNILYYVYIVQNGHVAWRAEK